MDNKRNEAETENRPLSLSPVSKEKGLVSRTVYETVPPKVEYSLTQTGKDLLPALNELYKWGEEQIRAGN